MRIEDELDLDPHEIQRLNERWEGLRDSLPSLRDAGEGEEPLPNPMDLEDMDE